MIVNFLLQKTPTDSDYAKVKVLKDIDEYVDSGKVQGRCRNLAFIMDGNSTGDISSVSLEKVNLSAAQKKQVKGQIGKLVCPKVVEVAEKHQILCMGFEATDSLVALSDPSAHLTSRSILSSSSDSTSSPMAESDLLGWDKVKKITNDAPKDEVYTVLFPLPHLDYHLLCNPFLQLYERQRRVLSSFIGNPIKSFWSLTYIRGIVIHDRSKDIENPQRGIVIEWKAPTSRRTVKQQWKNISTRKMSVECSSTFISSGPGPRHNDHLTLAGGILG
ncbi:hypothetical protein F5876DRAFT_62724 [Lentinula aff. lateritia]|uniref:Uncharacterized protein n=1 Tax=Lentinula aff. lateritia TaxID=2804960 RepID=A0ACC1UAU8_9AGAR|nr:hypothetical protein F5876DRAFT_62724 [Lentinula aff. lateritia]